MSKKDTTCPFFIPVCIIALFAIPAQSSAECIYYANGKTEKVTIVSRLKGSIWVARDNGSIGIPVSSITRIENNDGTVSKYDYETIAVRIQQLVRENNYALAVEWCDLLIETCPDYADLRSLRAAINQKLGNVDLAAKDYMFLMKKQLADAVVYNDQGVIFAAKRDSARAKECFLAAIRQVPGMTQAHGNLANIYMQQKDYPRAIEEYTQVLNSEPNNTNVLFNLGRAYRDSGDVSKARDAWKKVLTICPGDTDARVALDET
jgi:tetratricopeptide (TPR) repeat protein